MMTTVFDGEVLQLLFAEHVLVLAASRHVGDDCGVMVLTAHGVTFLDGLATPYWLQSGCAVQSH
jgi:hypothetical protein